MPCVCHNNTISGVGGRFDRAEVNFCLKASSRVPPRNLVPSLNSEKTKRLFNWEALFFGSIGLRILSSMDSIASLASLYSKAPSRPLELLKCQYGGPLRDLWLTYDRTEVHMEQSTVALE